MNAQDAKDFLTVNAQKGTSVSQVREAMVRVFTRLGGEDFIYHWAQKSPKNAETFMKILVQLMPREHKIGGDAENPLRLAAAHPVDLEKYKLKATCQAALAAPIIDAETEDEEDGG